MNTCVYLGCIVGVLFVYKRHSSVWRRNERRRGEEYLEIFYRYKCIEAIVEREREEERRGSILIETIQRSSVVEHLAHCFVLLCAIRILYAPESTRVRQFSHFIKLKYTLQTVLNHGFRRRERF